MSNHRELVNAKKEILENASMYWLLGKYKKEVEWIQNPNPEVVDRDFTFHEYQSEIFRRLDKLQKLEAQIETGELIEAFKLDQIDPNF